MKITTKAVTREMVEAARKDLAVLEGGVAIGWYGFRALITTLERGLEQEDEAADEFTSSGALAALAASTIKVAGLEPSEEMTTKIRGALAAAAGYGYRAGFEDGAASAEDEAADLEEGHSPQ